MALETIIFWLVILVLGVLFAWLISSYVPLGLWFSAIMSDVKISILDLVKMKLRNVPPRVIVDNMVTATQAGLNVSVNDLEEHYLATGDVPKVIKALISAEKADIGLTFKQAAAIDLAGSDVLEAVKISVNPEVINTPAVTAMARDGIQLIVKARVTVRANIDQLVGGAREETILARIGEGIVTAIGSSKSHADVLENPDKISKVVLAKGLDSGTAFDILSIDIADIDVGENIGAKLQIDQANADLKVAEAKAEERRAMAVAVEQEMKAKAQAARAKVIEAEAQIPQAMAAALRSGRLSIHEFHQFENMEADTHMRKSIANNDGGGSGSH